MHVCIYNFPEKHSVGAEARPVSPIYKHAHRFFSAKSYGSLENAVKEARLYAQIFNDTHPDEHRRPVRFNLAESRTKKHRSIPGVHRSTVRCSGYWGAGCPGGPDGSKPSWQAKFYVGTHGEEEARSLAIHLRTLWVQAVKDKALLEFLWKHQYPEIMEQSKRIRSNRVFENSF